jgi:hypothetical protein
MKISKHHQALIMLVLVARVSGTGYARDELQARLAARRLNEQVHENKPAKEGVPAVQYGFLSLPTSSKSDAVQPNARGNVSKAFLDVTNDASKTGSGSDKNKGEEAEEATQSTTSGSDKVQVKENQGSGSSAPAEAFPEATVNEVIVDAGLAAGAPCYGVAEEVATVSNPKHHVEGDVAASAPKNHFAGDANQLPVGPDEVVPNSRTSVALENGITAYTTSPTPNGITNAPQAEPDSPRPTGGASGSGQVLITPQEQKAFRICDTNSPVVYNSDDSDYEFFPENFNEIPGLPGLTQEEALANLEKQLEEAREVARLVLTDHEQLELRNAQLADVNAAINSEKVLIQAELEETRKVAIKLQELLLNAAALVGGARAWQLHVEF